MPGPDAVATLEDRSATLDALAREYDEFYKLCASLTDDEWQAQSLCPDWSVRDVVAHIVGTDRASVTGSFFLLLLPGRDIEDFNRRVVEDWRRRSTAELQRALVRWGQRQQRFLRVLSPVLWNLRMPTPMGRLRGRSLAGARIFDMWCHHYDITGPLGRPEPDAARTGPAIGWMLDAMGQMVGPALCDFRGRTIGIEITGPVSGRWLWTIGDADVAAVDEIPDVPDVDLRVFTDARTYVIAGSGREKPEEAAAEGRVKIDGDEELADAFLQHWYIY